MSHFGFLICIVASLQITACVGREWPAFSAQELQELKRGSPLSVLYFWRDDLVSTKAFLEEFVQSAKYLQNYGIKLAVIDCSQDKTGEEKCRNESAARYIFAYKDGVEMPFEVENMFDVDSIMANTLQLHLLNEVPIVQSRLERHELEKQALKKHNIIFAYPQAVGTNEHRIFMEVASTFHYDFKFVLTTEERTTRGLPIPIGKHNFKMWVLFCAQTETPDFLSQTQCHNVVYKGRVSLADVSNFVLSLSKQNVFHCPADGPNLLFEKLPQALQVLYIFTSEEWKTQTEEIVNELAFEVIGLSEVIVVDMDSNECKLLAQQHGFKGIVPQASVRLPNGTMVFMEYSREFSVKKIEKFFLSEIYGLREEVELATAERAMAKENSIDELIKEVETQDDQVAEAVFRLHMTDMQLEFAPFLLKPDFPQFISSSRLAMVLFFLPFDHVGMAFLRDFGYAADKLAKDFHDEKATAVVDCYDATDLCAMENITTYPKLRVFKKGKLLMDYEGSLDSTSVVNAYKLLQLDGPVSLKTREEVDKFMEGSYPRKFDDFTTSSVLLLAGKEHSEMKSIFQDVASSLSTKTAFGVVHPDIVKQMAEKYKSSIPSVIAHHRGDALMPNKVMQGDVDLPRLHKFVGEALIATMPELTVSNFPTLFAKKQPLGLLFLDESNPSAADVKNKVADLAMSSKYNHITFCWMSADYKSLGLKILSEYAWAATLPMFCIVDHQKGEVFNFNVDLANFEDIKQWIDRVIGGSERPSKILEKGQWAAPGRHYDFLAMIDEERGGHRQDYEEYNALPKGDSDEQVEEISDSDNEAREELRELRKSRLFNQRDSPLDHGKTEPSVHGKEHSHIEL